MFNLEECRWFYTEEIQFSANLTSPALIEAFATVPREKFLGSGRDSIPASVMPC